MFYDVFIIKSYVSCCKIHTIMILNNSRGIWSEKIGRRDFLHIPSDYGIDFNCWYMFKGMVKRVFGNKKDDTRLMDN